MGRWVVLKFRKFPDGGRGWFVKIWTTEIAQKIEIPNFLNAHELKPEVMRYRDSNMGAFTYDICSNLGGSKS